MSHRSSIIQSRPAAKAGLLLALLTLLSACHSPDAANIQLRKDKQALEQRLATLEQQGRADAARIAGFESGATTLPTLPEARLGTLYTAHGVKIGRLSGIDPDEPGTLKVYLSVIDDDGDVIKAPGTLSVEAFDLSGPAPLRVGNWDVDALKLRQTWRSLGPLAAFVVRCPLAGGALAHEELVIRIQFRDELTGRLFRDERSIKVHPPAAASNRP